jgi:hypothetical protein
VGPPAQAAVASAASAGAGRSGGRSSLEAPRKTRTTLPLACWIDSSENPSPRVAASRGELAASKPTVVAPS